MGISSVDEKVILAGHPDLVQSTGGACKQLYDQSFPENGGAAFFMLDRLNKETVYLTSYWSAMDSEFFLHKSTDLGASWELLFDTLNVITKFVSMFDEQEGVFFSTDYRQFRSLDGGYSWQPETYPFSNLSCRARYGELIGIGWGGMLAISPDRGRNWTEYSYGQGNTLSIDFISKDTILCVSDKAFLISFNGGMNWESTSLPDQVRPYQVRYRAGTGIYVIGEKSANNTSYGTIMKSKDLGKSWQVHYTAFESPFREMEFVNDSLALLNGPDGQVIRYLYQKHTDWLDEIPVVPVVNNYELYPNPASSLQHVYQFYAADEPEIRFFDLQGNELDIAYSLEQEYAYYKIQFDLSPLQAGIYFISVQNGNQVRILKSQKL